MELSEEDYVVEDDMGKSREGSRTDDEVVQRYLDSPIHVFFSVCVWHCVYL